ncbi:MAG: transposase [Bacteroidales bacterium]|nr:transposase [Bacteroidales bacterium]
MTANITLFEQAIATLPKKTIKSNLSFRKVMENNLPPVRHQNVLIDEIVELTGTQTSGKYPKQLRRVVVYNEEKGFTVELLTNNFTWAASTIGELYKSRWQIEIFFRHVKQLLHIKSFVGTSQNAVDRRRRRGQWRA